VELYEPINTLKAVGEDLWMVDGPTVRMAFSGTSVPFPTRMVVVQLADEDLFLWSSTKPDEGLREEIDTLVPVRHMVSPIKLHYVHISAWKRAYPDATTWVSPRVRKRAASRHMAVSFEWDLGDGPEEAWRGDLDQLIFRSSRFMEEVVFFDRKTRTLILADFVENFEAEKVGGFYAWLVWLAGVVDPDGKVPLDARLTFLGHKREARGNAAEAEFAERTFHALGRTGGKSVGRPGPPSFGSLRLPPPG
jgi:hypothetical protein